MYQVLFTIAIAAVAGAALVAPFRSYNDQLSLSIAAEEYITAVRLYRGDNCSTLPSDPLNRVFDNDLVTAGYLASLHPQIRFMSSITSTGLDTHYAYQDDGTGSNMGDLYRVTGGSANVATGGFVAMQLHIDEYSQGSSPPGFLQMMYFDEKTTRCLAHE